MKSVVGSLLVFAGCPLAVASLAVAQPPEPLPKFEAADVHTSAPAASPNNQFIRTSPVRNRRYEVKTATMVDLIRIAYGFDADKILGGPNWLELDRFDVIGKLPPETPPDKEKEMLQSLLGERFKLAVHKDTQPLPTHALTVGKKPQLKEANGSEQTGCRPRASAGPSPQQGGVRLFTQGPDGQQTTIDLGPGMTIHFECRNITMEAFAAGLRGMLGAQLGPNAVLDETGLKGRWDFDLTYSMGLIGPMMSENAERISINASIEKQLGLKLEEKQVPTPVLVVDKVERKPAENPPGTAEILPPLPLPTEFEVGAIKPSGPPGPGRMSRYQMQPGGRLVVEGMPLQFLIQRAFNVNNSDQVVGLPSSMAMDRYDVAAKLGPEGASLGNMDIDAIATPLLKLIADRFQMKYHTEERQVTAYALTEGKPKMKKADPASRIFCRNSNAPAPAPPGTRMLKCQNTTMALLAQRLQNMTQELNWPVQDATGLEGGWDFTLTFTQRFGAAFAGPGRGGDAPGNAIPTASDPTGGYTIFEAIEKELGLKLEKQKRSAQVYVIDHIEPKPNDN